MAYYNEKKVLSVVKTWFKGGSLTLNAHGRYIPQDYGYEGFTDVINEAPETPTDVKKYIEGDNIVEYLAFGTNVSKIAGNFQCFPNLETIYIQNATEVLDIVSNAWDGTKVVSEGEIIVPNNLLSAYQSRYPNWNFTSWQYQTEFTIPFIGETTLTAEYIQNVVNMTGGYINVVNKVIVPVEFTTYESGAIAKIQELFTAMRYLETTYEAGAMELDLQGDIVTKIVDIGKTLDEALVYARTWNNTNGVNLIIAPPYETNNPINFADCSNLVYIAKYSSNIATAYTYKIFENCYNLLEVNIYYPNARNFSNQIYKNNVLNSLKRWRMYFHESFTTTMGINAFGITSLALLEEVIFKNYNGASISNFTNSTQLTRQALLNLINSLGTNATTQTLIIGATNLNKLTAEDIAIATDKNWTLA